MNHVALSRRVLTRGAVIAALLFGALLVGPRGAAAGLMAGAAETIITPTPVGTFLIGPLKESTGVHDDLFARALVIFDGTTRVAIVTLDFLGLDFSFHDRIVAAIEKQTGIARGNIMVNCSHTHNAPLTIPWRAWEKKLDKPWHESMPGKIATVVGEASANRRAATLRFGREPVQIGFNRRLPTENGVVMQPNRSGTVVPWVDVLCVEADDGRSIAILFSHAAHPVIIHAASTLISADYPGFAVSTMREQLGKDGVFLFAHGCGANVNGFPLQGGIDAARSAGEKLGNAAVKAARSKGPTIQGDRLRSVCRELSLPLRPPPSVEQCEKLLAEDPANESKRELLEIARDGGRRSMRFPIQAFAIGDELCILGLPHEMFAEYQLFVDKTSPFAHNMVFAYTNGCEGYLGTDKDYAIGDRGGYETSPLGAPLQYHGRLVPEPQVETQITAGISKVLQDLHAGP
jgi:hypothetical protein